MDYPNGLYSRLPLEAPTFEEDEVVKEETNGDIPAVENGERRKQKREKGESTIELEKEEEGTNRLIKNWENGSSPQRQVQIWCEANNCFAHCCAIFLGHLGIEI